MVDGTGTSSLPKPNVEGASLHIDTQNFHCHDKCRFFQFEEIKIKTDSMDSSLSSQIEKCEKERLGVYLATHCASETDLEGFNYQLKQKTPNQKWEKRSTRSGTDIKTVFNYKPQNSHFFIKSESQLLQECVELMKGDYKIIGTADWRCVENPAKSSLSSNIVKSTSSSASSALPSTPASAASNANTTTTTTPAPATSKSNSAKKATSTNSTAKKPSAKQKPKVTSKAKGKGKGNSNRNGNEKGKGGKGGKGKGKGKGK